MAGLHRQAGRRYTAEHAEYSVPQLRSMEKTALEWFVRAEPGTQLALRVRHPKAEDAAMTVTLEG